MKSRLLILAFIVVCVTSVSVQAQYLEMLRRQAYIKANPKPVGITPVSHMLSTNTQSEAHARPQPPQLLQYEDGYGLRVYCKSDPINYVDPWGLETKMFHYRMKDGYGHEGIFFDGTDYDYGPIFIGDKWWEELLGVLWGVAPWSYNDDEISSDSNFLWKKSLQIRKSGSMIISGTKRVECKCATNSDIKKCLNQISADWNGSHFVIVGHSCRTFAKKAKTKCCLSYE